MAKVPSDSDGQTRPPEHTSKSIVRGYEERLKADLERAPIEARAVPDREARSKAAMTTNIRLRRQCVKCEGRGVVMVDLHTPILEVAKIAVAMEIDAGELIDTICNSPLHAALYICTRCGGYGVLPGASDKPPWEE